MFSYRVATVADIPFLAAIRLEVIENALTDPGRVTRAMYHDHLVEHGRGWVCEHKKTIVGFSIASLQNASIWALFVHPDYEGRGIGSKLLQHAVDWLFEQDVDMISLSTDPDTRAEELYKARGWERGEHISNGEILYRLRRT
jgi:GNAT superfamily N-acetyltransferase